MSKRHFLQRGAQIFALLGACGLSAWAQTSQPAGLNSLAEQSQAANQGGAAYKELHCGGYIRQSPLPSLGQIAGGEEEQDQNIYSQGDYIYLDMGADKGIRVGQDFAVVRPRGAVKSKFSRKGRLGVFVQEVGQVRVVAVKEKVSVAVITTSCDNMLLGDLLTDVPARAVTVTESSANLNRFTDANGKPTGRIVLARDAHEMITRNQIVYIDLGAEDNVRAGDKLTIFRPVGKTKITTFREVEVARGATGDFGSDTFKGGKFSNMAMRDQEQGSGVYTGKPLNTGKLKDRRPAMPRKVVGEMVILNVQERTATAMITVTAQEIHTGDFVEVK